MLKMPLLNKNFIKYFKFQIDLLNFINNAIFNNYGKMKNFDTLYFMHLVHLILNHLEKCYLANHHFQIGTFKWTI